MINSDVVSRVAKQLADLAAVHEDYNLQDMADALRGRVGAPGSFYDPHDCPPGCWSSGYHYEDPNCRLRQVRPTDV